MAVLSLTPDPRDAGRLVAMFLHDERAIMAIRAVSGRTWDQKRRAWTIPSTPDAVLQLRAALPAKWQMQLPVDLKASLRQAQDGLDAAAKVRMAGDSDIAFDYLTEPYAHQRAGLDFLAKLGSGALFWEMGLGKTKTAIDYAEWLGRKLHEKNVFEGMAFRVLVIAPNSVTANWGREIEKHAGHRDYRVLVGKLSVRAQQVATHRYTIVNTEALQVNAQPLLSALLAREWDLVVCDESTRFKTPGAGRTKNLLKLKAQRRVILTGTPITGKPEDAWSQMEFVQPGLLEGGFYAFKARFLEMDYWKQITGIKPHMEREYIRRIETRSYRIRKEEVLDLPPKVYVDREVELDGVLAKAYRQMQEELRVQLDTGDDVVAFNILTQLLRLTQITSGLIGEGSDYQWHEDNPKLKELDALLNEELRGQQVVIFGLYQRELEELARRYPEVEEPQTAWGPRPSLADGPAIIYGPTSRLGRDRYINEFQHGHRRLLFVQEHTGGIGINLTAAQTAIYFSRSWSLEDYLQSQDRLHRIGQTGTVTILHLVAKGTVDEDIAEALAGKQKLADTLTGDKARKLMASVLGGTR